MSLFYPWGPLRGGTMSNSPLHIVPMMEILIYWCISFKFLELPGLSFVFNSWTFSFFSGLGQLDSHNMRRNRYFQLTFSLLRRCGALCPFHSSLSFSFLYRVPRMDKESCHRSPNNCLLAYPLVFWLRMFSFWGLGERCQHLQGHVLEDENIMKNQL